MSRSGLLPIEQTVQDCLNTHFEKTEELRFIAGVSGGIDSMCLLHILNKFSVDTVAVHVNYGTRGEASNKDAAFVKQVCDELKVQCVLHKVDTRHAEYSNFQAWARKIRYQLFEEEAQKVNADGIAVAHHRDDQIETILQKMFRGSGLAGWTGMQEWDGTIFRPLLSVSRGEIEQYCETQSLAFRLDKSNLESNYARNFLRNEWLPELQQHFPGWRQNVLRIAEQADIFALALDYILQEISVGGNRLNRKLLLAMPLPLQKSLLLRAIHKLEPAASVSTDALSQLDELEALQTGKSLQLSEGLNMMRDRQYLTLIRKKNHLPAPELLHPKQLRDEPVVYEGFEFKIEPCQQPDFDHFLYLDARNFTKPLKIRGWRAGDRFQPLGMSGHQSVADHLTNRKISAAEKSKALVLQTFEETVAAVIFPPIKKHEPPGTVSEQFKCDDTTERCLTIKPVS